MDRSNGATENIAAKEPNGENDGPAALRILIAGAGIGGLSTALFLRQAGHTVEVFESSRFASETGAAIHIPPNVNGLLRRIGLMPEEYGAVTSATVTVYDVDGSRLSTASLASTRQDYPYPWQLLHRVDLHSALKDLSTSTTGKGTPVKIHLRSKVIDVDFEQPSITLADGAKHFGDLVIGADGVHSQLRTRVQPDAGTPFSSGSNAYRFLILISAVKNDPKTAHFVEQKGDLLILYGNNRRIVAYPCRNNTELNFVCMHPEDLSEGSSDGEWGLFASKETMLKVYESYSDSVRALLSKVNPEEIKLWKLLDCKPMNTWIKGKVALIGDAAHPFLPYQGQGGAQAIEDAAALGALLPLGTAPGDICRRLELYMQARKPRADAIQEATRQSAYDFKVEDGSAKLFEALEFAQYNFNHDAYHHASGVLKRDIFSRTPYRRMPTTFGPTPSPRQNLRGKLYNGTAGSTYRTTYVTFRTPKSYLETLLPSQGYKINCRAGWATATLSHTKLGNLAWLGGRGYSHFGLYIHDVSLPMEAGKLNRDEQQLGDFLPVVFENLADPIITGREELGFSKVFATLAEDQGADPSVITIRAGWDGLDFLTMTLTDVDVQAKDAISEREAPTFHYKCMPASGTRMGKGLLDSDYGTIATMPTAASLGGKKEKRLVAQKAKISFTELEGRRLEEAFPTLANIIAGLKEVKVGEIVSDTGAGSVEALGPSIIADLYFERYFSTAMAAFALFLSGGSQVGPVIAGYLIADRGWRWFFILCTILGVINFISCAFFLPETTYLRIYARDATAADADKEAEAIARHEEDIPKDPKSTDGGQSAGTHIEMILDRPHAGSYWKDLVSFRGRGQEESGIRALPKQFSLPFRFMFVPAALYSTLSYGAFLGGTVVISGQIPGLFAGPPYLFDSKAIGLLNLGSMVGIIIAYPIAGPLTDLVSRTLDRKNKGIHKPEHRLPALIAPFLLTPWGLILFAFTIAKNGSVYVAAVGFAAQVSGLAFVPSVVLSYIVDLYPKDSGEALVLVNAGKNLIAFMIVRVNQQWLDSEGLKKMYCEVAAIQWAVLVLAVPFWFAGPWLKAKTMRFL